MDYVGLVPPFPLQRKMSGPFPSRVAKRMRGLTYHPFLKLFSSAGRDGSNPPPFFFFPFEARRMKR